MREREREREGEGAVTRAVSEPTTAAGTTDLRSLSVSLIHLNVGSTKG